MTVKVGEELELTKEIHGVRITLGGGVEITFPFNFCNLYVSYLLGLADVGFNMTRMKNK